MTIPPAPNQRAANEREPEAARSPPPGRPERQEQREAGEAMSDDCVPNVAAAWREMGRKPFENAPGDVRRESARLWAKRDAEIELAVSSAPPPTPVPQGTPIAPETMRQLYEANPDGFWRLVRFEAEHEPDRLDYYAELELAEEHRKAQSRKRRAALSPPPGPDILTLEDTLARPENVRPAGPGRWTARCPVHEDRHPSLIVSENEARPGEPVVHCFAGCHWADVKDALKR